MRSLRNGRRPARVGVHRLNRTEYARSIQRDARPRCRTWRRMLPKDVSMDGFDNIAAVLRTSPAYLEQYIQTARNISSAGHWPCGQAKSSTHEYRVAIYVDQNAHVDGLPLGTRGGFYRGLLLPDRWRVRSSTSATSCGWARAT